MIYTKEEIITMLTGYKEVKKNRIKDIPRYTRIRYYDDRFKAGGMLLNVNTEDKTITLKNGTFIWKVKIENIQKIWGTDPEILRQREKEKNNEEKAKDKQREKDELEKCRVLLTMVKKGEVQIVKKGVKKINEKK
jgi:hypothetical protein